VPGTLVVVQDDAPQGPSHIAPMAMQLFDAIARGAESTHTRIATKAAAARQRLIATYYNMRARARGSRPSCSSAVGEYSRNLRAATTIATVTSLSQRAPSIGMSLAIHPRHRS